MKAADLNINLVETYFEMLKNLSADSKLELIAKLSNSTKTTSWTKKHSLESLYGAFVSKQSADEMINDIKQSRTFNRKRVSF
ncbi:MAG: hypothetical protein SGJ10_13975 [Bacteroidota bacterium]|nr:hypothetical protein [Bacteroidota bacterium]